MPSARLILDSEVSRARKFIASQLACKGCNASLQVPRSVVRCYMSRDGDENGTQDAYCMGHYIRSEDGKYWYFERDEAVDLSGGNFDLVDGSDTCAACHDYV